MRKKAQLFLLTLLTWFQVQGSPPLMDQDWWMEKGWFSDDTLSWVRISADTLPALWGTSVRFAETGEIILSHHAPKGRGFCGTGLPFIHDGEFKQHRSGKKIRFQLSGGHLGMDYFNYDLTYRVVKSTSNRIVMVKTRSRASAVQQVSFPDHRLRKGQLRRNSRSEARVTTV